MTKALKYSIAILILLALCLLYAPAHTQAATSALWGQNGELWTAQSRLPDFSFAGYRMGERAIPNVPVVANVKDFGARGDGATDDTQSFLNAISAVSGGALFVPAGRYVITRQIIIKKSNFVLRGEGPGRTVLYFPKPLKDMVGQGSRGGAYGWSWGGGVIQATGQESGSKLASATSPATRGDTKLSLSSTSGISVGKIIRLALHEDPNKTLMAHILHSGGVFDKRVEQVIKVSAIQGNQITLENPLRTDVRLSWRPEVFNYAPTIKEVGLEDFTIDFLSTPHVGHLNDVGYNGIELRTVSDSWVRNVTIRNADNGVFLEWKARFITVSGLRLNGRGGHHGIQLNAWAESNLVTGFRLDNTYQHDLTVSYHATGNVFSNGSGVNINMDHHRAAPFENLFTDINIGSGTRPYESSGDKSWGGAHSAARETFWNVRKASGSGIGTPDFPQPNVANGVTPLDIHQAQLAFRLANPNWPPTTPGPSPAPPPDQTPFLGVPFAVPGIIQAEDFDNGGEGVAYHDATSTNSGGKYRSTGVDIELSSGGGYNVGWMRAGEWLEYTVNMSAQSSYTLETRVASRGQGGSFHVEIDGVNVSGSVPVPDTGGWQTWATVAKTVSLPAGQHVLRIAVDANGPSGYMGNIDWLKFS